MVTSKPVSSILCNFSPVTIDLFSEYAPERGEGPRRSEKSYLMGEIVPGLHRGLCIVWGRRSLSPPTDVRSASLGDQLEMHLLRPDPVSFGSDSHFYKTPT